MGIFDKLFGDDSHLNKWALFTSFGTQLAMADGEAESSEGYYTGAFLRSVAGLNEAEIKKVFDKSQKIDPVSELNKFSREDKAELLNFLVDLAGADGDFDPQEYLVIIAIAGIIQADLQKITDIIMERDDVDPNKLKAGYEVFRKSKYGTHLPNLSFTR